MCEMTRLKGILNLTVLFSYIEFRLCGWAEPMWCVRVASLPQILLCLRKAFLSHSKQRSKCCVGDWRSRAFRVRSSHTSITDHGKRWRVAPQLHCSSVYYVNENTPNKETSPSVILAARKTRLTTELGECSKAAVWEDNIPEPVPVLPGSPGQVAVLLHMRVSRKAPLQSVP